MPYVIKYYPEAEIEYLEAFRWYNEQLEGLGDRFELSIEKRLKDIIVNPLIHPTKKYSCKECVVEDFPFIIVYKIFPKQQIILIVSIFHTSRNPKRKYR
jgi:hypothetical protein